MSKRNNCMFALPHELTGLGECCGLFRGQLSCNGLGRSCTGYRAHNAESRKALAEAIAERQKQKQKRRQPMRTKLLKKVRRYAENLFDTKLTRFKTENGRVTGISYVHEFGWAFSWLLGKRLDYHADRGKIVCTIARIAWDRFLRDEWTCKMRKEPRNEY